jgi:CMP/dCMP kinase
MIQIAIDGPSASGKSTIAKIIAENLKAYHINSGAVYRAVAFNLDKFNINFNDESIVNSYIDKLFVSVSFIDFEQHTFVNKEDVSNIITNSKYSNLSAIISNYLQVRKYINSIISKIIQKNSVVVDGRDIGLNILPNTPFKFYITASLTIRAKRRYEEYIKQNKEISYNEVYNDLKNRDYIDSNRKYGPLTQVKDAYVIDNSNLTISQVADKILDIVKGEIN